MEPQKTPYFDKSFENLVNKNFKWLTQKPKEVKQHQQKPQQNIAEMNAENTEEKH